jgi:type I restriction enzyme M protein
LLKVADEASQGRGLHVSLYGQEKDNATAGLARMNMILHDYATAEIKQGNTIASPLFVDGSGLKTFDYVVANPPFSDKRWSTGLDAEHDPWKRFENYGVPPGKQGDYAYLLHILRSLKSTGKGACILPHGVLFRGHAEADIRKNLIRRGVIKGIVGLPPNLFYGTGIPACIVVLDKEGVNARKDIFMIDASKGFIKDGNKNRLREQDIHKMVDIFNRQVEIPRYSRLVPVAEIADPKNDYNLNLPRYIDSSEPEDLQSIDGHLRGGIPDADIDALDRYWKVMPEVRAALFQPLRSGFSKPSTETTLIKETILSHPEFTDFKDSVKKLFEKWKKANTPLLKGFAEGGRPKALIETIAEDLLATFRTARLLDAYDVYQHLMGYWAETMQDDCYLISDDGWKAGAQPREILQVKNKDGKLVWPEAHDYKKGKRRFKSDLIPATILIARYFAAEQQAIEAIEAELAAIDQELEEKKEEQGAEGGLLEEVLEGEGTSRRLQPRDRKPASRKSARTPNLPTSARLLKSTLLYLRARLMQKPD